MAYIEPNGIIKLLANVPLNNNYIDTLYFSSLSAQQTYFNGKAVSVFDEQSYTRAQNNKIRVEIRPDQIYNCNYLMFQNQGFGTSKWFYAFITKTEYINNACCEITYEIDDMQTWFIQEFIRDSSTVLSCTVEREHCSLESDGFTYNEHNNTESIPIDDFICTKVHSSDKFKRFWLVAAISSNAEIPGVDYGGTPTSFPVVDGILQGVRYYILQGQLAAQNFFSTITDNNLIDSVVSLFYVPAELISLHYLKRNGTQLVQPTEPDNDELQNDIYNPPTRFNLLEDNDLIKQPKKPSEISFNGKIRNAKTYKYPYCYLGLQSPQVSTTYRYELFSNRENIQFFLQAPLQVNYEVSIMPINYILDRNVDMMYINSLTMDGFPQCPYSIDSFKAWLAQNKRSLIMESAITGATLGASSGLSNISSSLSVQNASNKALSQANSELNSLNNKVNVGSGVLGLFNSIVSASNLPPQTSGSMGIYTKMAIKTQIGEKSEMNVFLKEMRISDNLIRDVDDFFSKYGYFENIIKKPLLFNQTSSSHARPNFNYIKTVGLTFKGNAPVDSNANINNIFNRGITFWSNHDNVGNYSNNILDGNVANGITIEG